MREALIATRATLGIIEPLGGLVSALTEALDDHHVGGAEGRMICPICAEHAERIQALINRWNDAHARATEHVVTDG